MEAMVVLEVISLFEVYQDACVDLGWTPAFKKACDAADIAFFTSPYANDLLNEVGPYIPAFKIGSGDEAGCIARYRF